MSGLWMRISAESGEIVARGLTDEPTPGPGEEVVRESRVPGATWDPAQRGWLIAVATDLISVGRFKLLFTQGERIALRAAAKQSAEVEDFMDLLDGFTEGVSLADPVMTGAIGQLHAGGLLSADRAAEILAGAPPA